jgi:hypothetical protein
LTQQILVSFGNKCNPDFSPTDLGAKQDPTIIDLKVSDTRKHPGRAESRFGTPEHPGETKVTSVMFAGEQQLKDNFCNNLSEVSRVVCRTKIRFPAPAMVLSA